MKLLLQVNTNMFEYFHEMKWKSINNWEKWTFYVCNRWWLYEGERCWKKFSSVIIVKSSQDHCKFSFSIFEARAKKTWDLRKSLWGRQLNLLDSNFSNQLKICFMFIKHLFDAVLIVLYFKKLFGTVKIIKENTVTIGLLWYYSLQI